MKYRVAVVRSIVAGLGFLLLAPGLQDTLGQGVSLCAATSGKCAAELDSQCSDTDGKIILDSVWEEETR